MFKLHPIIICKEHRNLQQHKRGAISFTQSPKKSDSSIPETVLSCRLLCFKSPFIMNSTYSEKQSGKNIRICHRYKGISKKTRTMSFFEMPTHACSHMCQFSRVCKRLYYDTSLLLNIDSSVKNLNNIRYHGKRRHCNDRQIKPVIISRLHDTLTVYQLTA